MSKEPKISVIVPIYKAEKYLHKCVDSLLAQTFTDFEILLIDDGSPDKSGEICDDYALKDNRIRVFHKENGGVSSARQCGLDNARGEYTIHADPDDWVEANMLEELYAKAKEEDADMVICDFYFNSKTSQKYCLQSPSSLDHNTVMNELFQHLHGSTWNKLIRKSSYQNYNIRFDYSLSFCEDLFFNIQLLSNNITISYVNRAFYHYSYDSNEDSIVKKKSLSDLTYMESLYEKFDIYTKNFPCHNSAITAISYLLLSRVFFGNYLDSAKYKKACSKYKSKMLEYNSANFYMKVMLYLSCIGFYEITYKFFYYIYGLSQKLKI